MNENVEMGHLPQPRRGPVVTGTGAGLVLSCGIIQIHRGWTASTVRYAGADDRTEEQA
jgi:hypothetical protein